MITNLNKILADYNVLVTPENKKGFCEWYLGEDEHFCKATTNKTCKYCHMYSPVHGEKLELFAKLLTAETKKVTNLRKQVKEQADEITRLKRDIARLMDSEDELLDENDFIFEEDEA